MKNLIYIVIFIMTTVLIYGQSNYKMPFNIDKNGTVKNESGNKIGSVTKNEVFDEHGNKLAFLDGQGNLIDAKTNKKIGRIAKNSTVF
jgi:hypothetical protein